MVKAMLIMCLAAILVNRPEFIIVLVLAILLLKIPVSRKYDVEKAIEELETEEKNNSIF